MKKELFTELKTAYPKLLAKIEEDSFYVGDGWFNLLFLTCERIQVQIDNYISDAEYKEQIYAVQIKEKFGTLRFYLNKDNPAIRGIVDMAEAYSRVVCEECGNVGKKTISTNKVVRTFCDVHLKENDKKTI